MFTLQTLLNQGWSISFNNDLITNLNGNLRVVNTWSFEVNGHKEQSRSLGFSTAEKCLEDFLVNVISHRLESIVYGFKCSHTEGFTDSDLVLLLAQFPMINEDYFIENLSYDTTIFDDLDRVIRYKRDVLRALRISIIYEP